MWIPANSTTKLCTCSLVRNLSCTVLYCIYCKRVCSKLRRLFSKLICDTFENTGGKLFYKIQHMLNQKHERCVRNICRIHATFWQNKISICFLSTGVNIIWRYLCFRGEYFVFNLDDRKAPSIHQRIWSRKGGDHIANKPYRSSELSYALHWLDLLSLSTIIF